MAEHHVTFFSPFPFEPGQKIHITSGPRKGDWEVLDVSDRKVKLRCPVSMREFEWDRFCFTIEEGQVDEWPHRD